MKEEITKVVMNFFEVEMMPEGVNETIIVLIPKGNDPKTSKITGPSIYAM